MFQTHLSIFLPPVSLLRISTLIHGTALLCDCEDSTAAIAHHFILHAAESEKPAGETEDGENDGDNEGGVFGALEGRMMLKVMITMIDL
jgi:hypothetical protein